MTANGNNFQLATQEVNEELADTRLQMLHLQMEFPRAANAQAEVNV